MKEVIKVYETTDYSIFKNLQGNRSVNKLHTKRLKESFQKCYLLSPIIVNEKYEIIDGQHRFNAAKELELPIRFIIVRNYGLREVQVLNENMKNWQKKDYLKAYCDLGFDQYLKFRSFMQKYPDFGMESCEILLRNSTRTENGSRAKDLITESNKNGAYLKRSFQEGDFEIKDLELAIENAEKIIMIKPFFIGFNQLRFVRSMISIFKNENYNHAKFLKQLRNNPTALQVCANVTQYKLLIEDIYNFKSREKVSLRY